MSRTGGAAEHQPGTMGVYRRAGSLWQDMIPIWKNDNDEYLTPDANSNPILLYCKWIVGETVGSYDPG